MELIAIQFLSVRVPSGQIVTLHTGNRVELDAADAQYLLAEYPDRVRAEGAPAPVAEPVAQDAPADVSTDTTDETDTDAPKAKRKPTKK